MKRLAPFIGIAVHCSLLVGAPRIIFNTTLANRNLQIKRIVIGPEQEVYLCGDALNPSGAARDSADAFLSRLTGEGKVAWIHFFRGNRTEFARGLAVDASGAAYIVGSTDSSDFPTVNAFLPTSPSGDRPFPWQSGFVAKVDKQGRVIYSTYLGGSNETIVNDVTVDANQRPLITGHTRATNFPTTAGSYKPVFPAASSPLLSMAFATQFSSDGRSLVASTFLGGDETSCTGGGGCSFAAAENSGRAVRMDSAGNIVIGGSTTASNFPVVGNSQPADGFVARLNSALSTLQAAAYAPVAPSPGAMALNASAGIFMGGSTSKRGLPASANAIQREHIGCAAGSPTCVVPNGYVYFLNPDGSIPYSSYVGGSGAQVAGVALADGSSYWFSGNGASSNVPANADAFLRGGDFLIRLNPLTGQVAEATRFPDGIAGAGVDARGTRVLVAGRESGMAGRIEFSRPSRAEILAVSNSGGRISRGIVSPGQLVSIFGVGIGSKSPISQPVGADGRFGAELGGIRCYLNNRPMPLLYAQEDQINAATPFDSAMQSFGTLEIWRDGQIISTYTVDLVPTDVEIFSDPNRSFVAAAVNEDGTINSDQNRARRGSVVSIFGTGFGDLTPRPLDGQISVAPLATLGVITGVSVGEGTAEVLYAGPAPGQIAGVTQVNLRIPGEVGSGLVSVGVTVGAFTAMTSIWVAF